VGGFALIQTLKAIVLVTLFLYHVLVVKNDELPFMRIKRKKTAKKGYSP